MDEIGALHPGQPMTIAYDTGHAALAAFTEGLALQAKGTGVNVSLFCLGSAGPRVGQNTRSRGIGRWLGDGAVPQEGRQVADDLAATLVDALHHPRFAIAGDPQDRASLQQRWGYIESSLHAGVVSPPT